MSIETGADFSRPVRTLTKLWQKQNGSQEPIVGPGCPYGCIYCNQQGLDKGPNGEKTTPYLSTKTDTGISVNSRLMVGKVCTHTIPQEALLSELRHFPYYSASTPLILENFHDPSLNWQQSFGLAESLLDKGHLGEVIYITKGKIALRHLTMAKELVNKGAKLIFIVTYSGLPQSIEPIPASARISTILKLKQAGLPVILSMRPLIDGINSSEVNINKVLREVGTEADAITVGGLYVYDFTDQAFRDAGHSLSDKYMNDQLSESKIIDQNLRFKIRQIAQNLEQQTPIFDHTSCATAYLSSKFYGQAKHDRLAHWAREHNGTFDYCQSYCPTEQIANCEQASLRTFSQARELGEQALKRMGYNYELIPSPKSGTLLIANGDLHLSETFFVSEATGWNVENCPSQERLSEKTANALSVIGLAGCRFETQLQPNFHWQVTVWINNSQNANVMGSKLKLYLQAYVRASLDIIIEYDR